MSDYLIREYKKEDIPELTRLWLEVFDEDPRLPPSFFDALEHMGSGLLAEIDGKIVGAGYCLEGQELASGGEKKRIGHIYGIAVRAEYRSLGIGRAIVKGVAALSTSHGAQLICCEPANQSLVKWYDDVLGLKPALYRQERTVTAKALVSVSPISGPEYAKRREALLRDKNRVVLSDAAMGFEEDMLKIYGGGFYAAGGGIAAAYLWEDTAIIRELICPDEEYEKSAAGIAAALSAREARLFPNAAQGQAYILSDRALPSDCVWNLSFN